MRKLLFVGIVLLIGIFRFAYTFTKPPAKPTRTSYINRFVTKDTVIMKIDMVPRRRQEKPIHLKLGTTIPEVLKALHVRLPSTAVVAQRTMKEPDLLIIFMYPAGNSRYIVFRDGKLYGQDEFNATETARIESQRPESDTIQE